MRVYNTTTTNGQIPKSSPREKGKYNVFFRMFFCWLEPLFCIGCRRSLHHSDLYTHPPEVDSRYLQNKFKRYWSYELQRRHNGQSPRLWLVILKCFWWRILLIQILTFVLITIFIAQGDVLGLLTNYFTIESPSSTETTTAYLLAMTLSLLSLTTVFVNFVFYAGRKLGGLIRILFTSVIYEKVLTLSQTTLSQLTMGHVINLASNDVHRFDEAIIFFPFFLVFPVHLIAVTYLLFRQIQWSAVIAIGVLVTLIPLQFAVAAIYAKIRTKAAKLTDRRVKVMNEVITGIRVIKMYAWEYAFSHVVSTIRRKEILITFLGMTIKAFALSYSILSSPLAMCIVFSVYTSVGGQLTPRKVFSALTHLNFLRYDMIHFILGLLQLSESYVGYKRIKDFLILPELFSPELHNKSENTSRKDCSYSNTNYIALQPLVSSTSDKGTGIYVQDLTASWSMDIEKPTLKNISFNVDQTKSLLVVVGSVGSGKVKSTLLQCLLKELPPLNGNVEVRGSIGYASQESFVFSNTLRENVLFGFPYQSEWYNTVIEACALDKDIELLPYGDLTLVGERGVTLSGGQKARVNLARAVYRQADIYLLDDPLSAVDTAVSRHIFDRCIKDLLSDKIVVLVTHQLQYLEQCDIVLGLMEGSVTIYGSPTKILDDKSALTGLLDMNAQEDAITNCSDSSIAIEQDAGIKTELSSQSTDLVKQEHTLPDEERAHGTISIKTYYQYFKAGGGYIFTLITLILLILSEANLVAADWWISDWAECTVDPNNDSTTCKFTSHQRIQVYTSLIAGLFLVYCVKMVLLCVLFLRASQVLHNRMFSHVLRAPVHFFDTNPIGRVLNRFSKDIGFMDDLLAYNFIRFLAVAFRVTTLFLIAVVANYYLLIALTIVFVSFLTIRWYYLKTARDVKRLEALARSPLYSHLSITLQGLATIRSYSMETIVMEQFHDYQNKHSETWYIFLTTTRWFSLRVDLLAVLYISVTLMTSVPLAESLDPALVALSLAYVATLTDTFSFILRLSTEIENSMISPERVIAYGKLESEASLETHPPTSQPPSEWPNKGHIVLSHVSYRHSTKSPFVLHDISCDIKSREKIGIVGRTGAGKSSLVAALFRLAEPHGSIMIDEIEVSQLGLHDLRKNISIIPQDPVLFGGTVRYNLDPFKVYNDSDIWTALEQVQLKNTVEIIDGQLEATVTEGGGNFSVGQRQLFCLARALLRNNSIIVLDEATANVDLETDNIIQQVIRDQFSHCTVLTIAHRLDSVMDSDKIMVLHGGEVVEYDEPHLLLCQPTSYLGMLVDHTGTVTAQKLRAIALEKYNCGART